jgi:hypothetical protein
VAPWLALGVIGWLLWELKPVEWLAAGVIIVASALLFVATQASRRARVPA